MKKPTRHLYEGIYIINATLSEEAVNKALEKIKASITAHGGEFHKIHDLGKRKLGFAIDKRKEGYFYITYFSVNPTVINELWSEYHLNEDLIRFMTKRVENVQEELTHRELVEVS